MPRQARLDARPPRLKAKPMAGRLPASPMKSFTELSVVYLQLEFTEKNVRVSPRLSVYPVKCEAYLSGAAN